MTDLLYNSCFALFFLYNTGLFKHRQTLATKMQQNASSKDAEKNHPRRKRTRAREYTPISVAYSVGFVAVFWS